MPILLAYAFDRPVATPIAVAAALDRVEQYLNTAAAVRMVRRGLSDPHQGVLVWDVADARCRWPFWSQSDDGNLGVATTYVPFGWPRLTGDLPFEQAALELGRRLVTDSSALAQLDPPMIMAVRDRPADTLTVVTDGLGYGRLYEMRIPSSDALPSGWAWSNYVGALPVFAGVAPEISVEGWRYLAATGWFMDDTTSIEGIRQLGPGAVVRVRWHVRSGQKAGALDLWVRPRRATSPLSRNRLSAMRDGMVQTVRSIEGLWPDPPAVHLSGGRDSRLVAAAVIASGIDADFVTHDNLQGEVDTVLRLIGQLPRKIDHRVVPKGSEGAQDGASESSSLRERVLRHLLVADGMSSPSHLGESMPAPIRPRMKGHLSGAGGELAHGHFYPGEGRNLMGRLTARFLEIVRQRRTGQGQTESRRIGGRLRRKIIDSEPACSRDALEQFDVRMRQVVNEAIGLGLHGLSIFDGFYLLERLRRWNSSNLRAENLTLLVSAAFIRATFDLGPRRHYSNALHLGLIGLMMPQWRDVPFYAASELDRRSARKPRAWASTDADQYEQIIFEDQSWHDVFDPETVRRLWTQARANHPGYRKDKELFRRVAWRACFDEHLRLIAQAAVRPPSPMPTIHVLKAQRADAGKAAPS